MPRGLSLCLLNSNICNVMNQPGVSIEAELTGYIDEGINLLMNWLIHLWGWLRNP